MRLRSARLVALLSAVLGAATLGCATAAPAAPAGAATLTHTPIGGAEDDVVALKERVGRLERRLADVDAKLGLLLAQRTPREQRRGPSSISSGSLDHLGPRDLIVDEPRAEEASLGARAIDLPRRQAAIEDEQPVESVVEDDGSAPVFIKLHGEPSSSSGSSGSPGAASVVEAPSFSSVDEGYAWAQMRLKEGRHLEAISALEDIVARSPGHDLADNSVYWIGWAHAQRGDHRLAVDVWSRLPLRFARSAKVPDALFGMAQSHEALGEPAVAETLYEQLVSQYPKAERAKDAKKALARLRPR